MELKNTKTHKIVSVILAGGNGFRFGNHTPKQFIKLAGKLVIEHTVEIFQAIDDIDEIIIVSNKHFVDFVWGLVERNRWTKVHTVVIGGEERFDSTLSAIKSLDTYNENTKVLFHDAARPLVTPEIIKRCIHALETFDAVDVVIETSDTIVQITDSNNIFNIPVRNQMRRGQTPQGFKLGVIRDAYNKAVSTQCKNFSCDCSVLRSMNPGVTVTTVSGAESNLKITTSLDLFTAEKLVQTNSLKFPNPDKEIENLRDKVVIVIGGAYGIGKAIVDFCRQHAAVVYTASRSISKVDVTDKESISSFFLKVYSETKRIDYIVNTAGILIKKPISLMSDKEINDIVGINLIGAINVAYCAKEYLRASHGSLLNFTSSSYTRGRAFYAVYSATKAGIVNLTQALSEEWNEEFIRVNCINPERTNTPMRRTNFGIEPINTLLSPDSVAKISVLALVSNHTGLIIDVKNI
jgi:2-C-methyl-D-erythritol 4-phosphate cytidylyltransferase